MTSILPHQRSHHDPDMTELQRGLSAALDRAVARPSTPPPADPDAAPRHAKWGPSSQRVTSPMEILLEVVDDTYRLQQQVEALVTAVTGETAAPLRLRDVGAPSCGLLPNVARLAAEISSIHAQIGKRIEVALRAVT